MVVGRAVRRPGSSVRLVHHPCKTWPPYLEVLAMHRRRSGSTAPDGLDLISGFAAKIGGQSRPCLASYIYFIR